MNQVLAIERIGPLRRGISCYARPTYAVGSRQMQRTCTIIFYKDGKLVCRGAGDSHLPRSLRARSPHVLSPVGGSTAQGRGTKFREPTGQRMTAGNYAGALELDTSSSRHGADWTAPAGDFVLCTTNLRSWIAADATHLHHDFLGRWQSCFGAVQAAFLWRL